MNQPLPPLGGTGLPTGGRGVLAAIACVALFGICQGMTHPLFALRLEEAGWSSGMIGISGAMVAIAALTTAPFMPPVIRWMGLPGFLAAAAVLSAASLVAFPVYDGFLAWLGLRYVQGIAATALFLGSENWIVADAEEGARGRIIGLYATVLSLGFASGPLILTAVGHAGALPFAVCAVLSLICILPLITAWHDAPKAEAEDAAAIPPLRFLVTDPTVMGAVILFGAIEFGVMALMPVWGVKSGFSAEASAFLVTTLVLGNVAFQMPLGALADGLNRRAMLVGCALSCVAAAAALPWLVGESWVLWLVLFIWGGIAAGLYTIALIELGARYKGQTLVSANAAVIIGYGIGALVGPLFVGGAMDLIEPHGLSLALGVMATAYLAVAVLRARRRRAGTLDSASP
jgi:MFS family permease